MTMVGSTSSTSSSTTSGIGGTYGLSGSGVDVDSVVQKLMAGQQAVEDSLVQKQTVLQWQKTAYNTVYDDLNTFNTSTVFNYKLQATLSPNTVSSSNTSVATATANAAAANINHSLVVSQLASGVNLTSSSPISTTQPPTLGTLATQMGLSSNSFSFTIANGSSGSKTISIDPTTDSINDVVSAINNAGVNVTASYDSTLDRLFLSTTNSGSSAQISISSASSTGSTDYAAAFISKLNLFSGSTSAPASTATVNYGSNSLTIINAGAQTGTVTIKPAAVQTGVAAQTGTTDGSFSVTDGVAGTSLNGVKVAFSSTALTGTSSATALTSSWDASTQTLTISGNLSSGGSAAENSTAITTAIQSGLTTAGFKVGAMTDTAGATGTAAAFAGNSITFGGGVTSIASADTMAVDENDGNLTIYLANTTAANNSAANIQAAVQALGSGSTNFSNYTFTGSANWDTTAVGSSATGTVTGTLSSGNTNVTTFTSATGADAEFTLDNANLTESSNNFTISGVTYNLTGVTPTDSPATSISVSSDIQTAVANVQSFVDAYNKILAELNGDITQPRYTDYPPLTSDQESSMSASDITLWNQKAQSGMLYNDQTLTDLVNNMREAVSNPVSGVSGPYNSLSAIGITTGDYTEGGKLYLNTDTLEQALQANPNVLNQLFGTPGTTTTTNGVTTTDTSTEGVAGRLSDAISNSLTQLNQIAGTTASASYDTSSNLAQEIADYTTQITNAQDQYSTMQSQYYTEYNAMEVAIQQIGAQSSWISSMLGTSSSG